MEFSYDHRFAVYAGAIHISPPVDTWHWFDQPILAPYDDYVLDVEAFVIDTATNESLPILKLSAADPTDNFYADRQVDWDTESTFNGGRVPSRHFTMRVKRSFLSKIFTIILLIVNWFLTAGCLRITLLSVVGHKEMGDGVLLLPITVILTIPALRQLYVGSPPFGMYLGRYLIYFPYSPNFAGVLIGMPFVICCMLNERVPTRPEDVVGFFLQIITVSLCSLVLLMRMARDRKRALDRGRGSAQEEERLFQNDETMEEEIGEAPLP